MALQSVKKVIGEYSSINNAYNVDTGSEIIEVYHSDLSPELVRHACEYEAMFEEFSGINTVESFSIEEWEEADTSKVNTHGVLRRPDLKRMAKLLREELISHLDRLVDGSFEYVNKLKLYSKKINRWGMRDTGWYGHGFISPKQLFVNTASWEPVVIGLQIKPLSLLADKTWQNISDPHYTEFFQHSERRFTQEGDSYAISLSLLGSITSVLLESDVGYNPIRNNMSFDSWFELCEKTCKKEFGKHFSLNALLSTIKELRKPKTSFDKIRLKEYFNGEGFLASLSQEYFENHVKNDPVLTLHSSEISAFDSEFSALIKGEEEYSVKPLVIIGEPGTGKTRLANLVHDICAPGETLRHAALGEINRELLLSTIFGHKKGAFTGAVTDSPGLIEAAKGGTLFLDELQDISPEIQQALLRVLQCGTYNSLGSTDKKICQTRIVLASNKPLMELLQNGTIREDFYQRVSTYLISLDSVLLMQRNNNIVGLKQIVDTVILTYQKKLPERVAWIQKHINSSHTNEDIKNILKLTEDVMLSVVFDDKCREVISKLPYPHNFRSAEKYGRRLIDKIDSAIEDVIMDFESLDKIVVLKKLQNKLPTVVKSLSEKADDSINNSSSQSIEDILKTVAHIANADPDISRQKMAEQCGYSKSVSTFNRVVITPVRKGELSKPKDISDEDWAVVEKYAKNRR